MVELPSGRMKTREGTVVDADEILDEMEMESEKKTKLQGKTEGFGEKELQSLYQMIGLGGLKFFLLRVDPKKRMLFNPEESIDLHGYTATFIQYAHARIQSILRKEEFLDAEMMSAGSDLKTSTKPEPLLPLEKSVILQIARYPQVLEQACAEMNPSLIANFAYQLAKIFNSFYGEHSIGNAETRIKKVLRLQIAIFTAKVLESAMAILGIKVPERM
jgi:arginyl-tRNA synthetase